jgi:hypothetical protein
MSMAVLRDASVAVSLSVLISSLLNPGLSARSPMKISKARNLLTAIAIINSLLITLLLSPNLRSQRALAAPRNNESSISYLRINQQFAFYFVTKQTPVADIQHASSIQNFFSICYLPWSLAHNCIFGSKSACTPSAGVTIGRIRTAFRIYKIPNKNCDAP